MSTRLPALLSVLLLAGLLAQLAAPDAAAQQTIPLWPEGAPGAVGSEEVDRPTLTIHLPENGNGTAVVVCPGGGYRNLAMDHEGRQVAEWLNERGIAAFVLKYRLGHRYRHPAPLSDVRRALRMVRSGSDTLGIDPERIGVWGFSAGGHLAATASTQYVRGDAQAEGPIDRVSSRPDFSILAYPVISLAESYTHQGSRQALLGEDPDPALVSQLSNERHVTSSTPPAFLFHTDEDEAVPAENSVAYYLALRRNGVPAELHVYRDGRHGVGLAPGDPVLGTWPDRLEDWLRAQGLLGG
ncbi:MAG: alpha/beta hydrolase [Rhodothermales bacterium]